MECNPVSRRCDWSKHRNWDCTDLSSFPEWWRDGTMFGKALRHRCCIDDSSCAKYEGRPMYCSPINKKCYPERERYWGCAWYENPQLQLVHGHYKFSYSNYSDSLQAWGTKLQNSDVTGTMNRGTCCVHDSNCDQSRAQGPMICSGPESIPGLT